MTSKTNWFSKERFETLRLERSVTWGRPVRVVEETASTNDLALAALHTDAKTGIAWVARQQTRGRGRRGHRWIAPAGQCLLFSTMLRYPGRAERLTGMSLAVGLCCRDVVTPRLPASAPPVCVKWPNDLMVGDQKLAGILIETRFAAGEIGIVVGVGLNVSCTEFPENLAGATSLRIQGATDLEQESLLVDLLGALQRRLSAFFVSGFASVKKELHDHDFLLGKTVDVDRTAGCAQGFDELGRLRLKLSDGRIRVIDSGHVTLL